MNASEHPFIQSLKTEGFDLISKPVEYNLEEEVLAEYDVNQFLLANYFDISLKDGQWMEFYTEYHLDRDELTAFAILKDRDAGDKYFDFELSDEEAFMLMNLQSEYLKKNTPFQFVSDYGKTAKEIYSSVLSIDDGDVVNATISLGIGVTDNFLDKYCDTGRYPIQAEDELDEYYHDFVMYKNVETGKLSFEDHVSNVDYSDSDVLEIDLPDTVAACLYDAVCMIYQNRTHEALSKWEDEVLQDYQMER